MENRDSLKRTMNKVRFLNHAFVVVALAALAASASAQHRPPYTPPSPETRAKLEYAYGLVKESEAMLRTARNLLVAGDLEKAWTEAERALERVAELAPSDANHAHQVLAEIYVAKGQYALALNEIAQGYKEDRTVRSLATEALALIGVGRAQESRPLLAKALKGDKMVVELQGDWTDLPAVDNASGEALAATAYLLRAVGDYEEGKRQDLESAQRLAPRNPVVGLSLATFYRKSLRRPDLARKALEKAHGGTKATRDLLARELGRIKIAEVEAAAKPNG